MDDIADFDVTPLGSTVVFQPLNPAAQAWWRDNIQAEWWQYDSSGGCAIDLRYVHDILARLAEECFEVYVH
jgi:hypothetical protein